MEEQMTQILSAGTMSQLHIEPLIKIKENLTSELAPHLLVLVEATKMEEWDLLSCIGHENGKPYHNLYNCAKSIGALNKFSDSVHPVIRDTYLPYRRSVLDGTFDGPIGHSGSEYVQAEMSMKPRL